MVTLRECVSFACGGGVLLLGISCGGDSGQLADGGLDGTIADGMLADGLGFGDGYGGDGYGGPCGDAAQGALCSGTCTDLKTDPKNCGGCGNACVGCEFCADGKCACPAYQSLCNGQCIPTSTDPDNCGGCGVVCTSSQVCSAGKCVTLANGCIPPPQGGNPGLVPCNRQCVDPYNDDNNCGACGVKCPSGEGCAAGSCVDVISVGSPPQKCGCGGGPPIIINNGKDCLGNVAQTVFGWALCSCGDINLAAKLNTDSYDSTKGPYPPNPLEYWGGVGLNGTYTGPVSNPVRVGGPLWSSGINGVTTDSPTTVHREGHVAGGLTASIDPLSLLDDAYVVGNVTGNSSISVAKTLYLSSTSSVSGTVTYGAKVTKALSVPPPCAFCGSQGLPIAQWITNAATTNDNALIGLSKDVFATPSNAAGLRLDLPCGVYYLSEIDQPGVNVTINATGRTALFIDGDVVGQIVSFVLTPDAEFDVFIKGTVTTGGELVVGSPNYPALSRTYIASSNALVLSGEAGRLGGNIYAGYAPVSVTSHLVLYGGLDVGNFSNQETADIHYDSDVTLVGSHCPPPPPTCGTCKDCNNQACINGTCGSCTDSSQCCPPLVCNNGTCVAVPN